MGETTDTATANAAPNAGAPSGKPLDRRTEILDHAAVLFRRFGFAEVGIDDIGRAAGVSGPALYRHFDGKQELLDLVIGRFLTTLTTHWADLEEQGVDDAILPAVIRSALDQPNEYYVYSTQRHWLTGDRATAQAQARRPIQEAWHALLESLGVVAGGDKARFRLVAMEGVLMHASLSEKASRSARSTLALTTSAALLSVDLPALIVPAEPRPGRVLRHHNRREEVFAAAIGLFAERGYTAVTLKDIGAEVGVSASAIHRHFESKDAILATAVSRSADQMQAAIAVAIARSATAREAIEDIAGRFSVLFTENPELFGLNLHLATSLPSEVAFAVRAQRKMYRDEVAHLLIQAVPGLSLAVARVRVGAMLSVLNNVVRNRHLAPAEDLTALLTVVSTTILLQDPASP